MNEEEFKRMRMRQIRRCALCGREINRNGRIQHSNIYNNPPNLFFCTDKCKNQMLELMRKYPKEYVKFTYFNREAILNEM